MINSSGNDLLAHLQQYEGCDDRLVYTHLLPARSAEWAWADDADDVSLPPPVTALYTHQLEALALARRGGHLVLATPTASGKTLALALPGLEERRRHPDSCVLCIVPTRALAEQWQRLLDSWESECTRAPASFWDRDLEYRVASYTSDTPKAERLRIRDAVRWLIMTPDMVHQSLLPYHRLWKRFLTHLTYVIVDESHVYRGVFGSHVGLVLRRLRRLISHYATAEPTYLFASATIGNPAEHAAALLGQPVVALTESGAPTGQRVVALWQPPDFRAHSDEAAEIAARAIAESARTILFGQTRQSVERMLRQVRALLPPRLRESVAAYRAGYLASHRHEIEQRLAAGDLRGVVTTNALELGIDIGELDVSILDGFPGSIASFWQQAGRAGRGEQGGTTILVLRQDALDQYFAAHPDQLVAIPAEHALVNLANSYILPRHLHCAARELPLTSDDLASFGLDAPAMAAKLVHDGTLVELAGELRPSDRYQSPQHQLSLRQIGRRLKIVDSSERVIEETDEYHAIAECYKGAVYYSQGESYLVRHLDLNGRVQVEPREVAYYTEPSTWEEVTILSERERKPIGASMVCFGTVQVTLHVAGFVRIDQRSRVPIDHVTFPAPLTRVLQTQALWIEVSPGIIQHLASQGLDPLGSLHAAEHAMIGLLPLFVLGDRRDLGGVSISRHHQTDRATIFIYDGYPGGIGYAEEAFRRFEELAEATQTTVAACPCEAGCYACVQSPKCGNENRPLDKDGAVEFIRALLGSRVDKSSIAALRSAPGNGSPAPRASNHSRLSSRRERALAARSEQTRYAELQRLWRQDRQHR